MSNKRAGTQSDVHTNVHTNVHTIVHTNIHIAPTLAAMAAVYQLSREGGPRSERFAAYVKRVEHEWGVVHYNPMAGSAALETVQQLLQWNAEAVAESVATDVATRANYTDQITLAVAVRSNGMWTDRIATEIDERMAGKVPRQGFGVVSIWSREPCTLDDVKRESAAETVRVMWSALHGAATTLRAVIAREGLAYAMAAAMTGSSWHTASLAAHEISLVTDALELLGDSVQQSDMVSVVYGDGATRAMGWTPLGIPDNAGFQWATARAAERMRELGPAVALRANAHV